MEKSALALESAGEEERRGCADSQDELDVFGELGELEDDDDDGEVGGDAFLSPLELSHKIRIALSSEAEASVLAPPVLEQWIELLGEMLSGSGDLPDGDADLHQEEILDLIDRIEAVLDTAILTTASSIIVTTDDATRSSSLLLPPAVAFTNDKNTALGSARTTPTLPLQLYAPLLVGGGNYHHTSPATSSAGIRPIRNDDSNKTHPSSAGAASMAMVGKAAVSKVWAAAGPALPALAKHLQSVMPPSAPETPTRSERVVVCVSRDAERGFCSQFAKTLRITAFRPLASGGPGPLEEAGTCIGDRLVRIGLEKMAGKSLPEAMAVLADNSAGVERVELEFVREVPI